MLVSCFHSNIRTLTNAFNIPDMNITEETFGKWLTYYNTTNPHLVQNLSLKTCNLETFLDEVLLHTIIIITATINNNGFISNCKGNNERLYNSNLPTIANINLLMNIMVFIHSLLSSYILCYKIFTWHQSISCYHLFYSSYKQPFLYKQLFYLFWRY